MTNARRAPSALVTGAASGLGRATAAVLRSQGFRVAGLDIHVAECQTDISVACDVSDTTAVADAVASVDASWDGLDAVAHCAGMFPPSAVPLHSLDPDVWRRTVDVNLTGAFSVARATLPALMRRRGAMVLVASTAAHQPQPGAAVYAATKAGVAGLVRAIAIEYAHRGVRVNAISPGWMDTTMASPILGRPALRDRIEKLVPLGRVADPGDVAATIAWLLSDAAAYITGQDFMVDAGMGLTSFVDEGDVDATWHRVKDKHG